MSTFPLRECKIPPPPENPGKLLKNYKLAHPRPVLKTTESFGNFQDRPGVGQIVFFFGIFGGRGEFVFSKGKLGSQGPYGRKKVYPGSKTRESNDEHKLFSEGRGLL